MNALMPWITPEIFTTLTALLLITTQALGLLRTQTQAYLITLIALTLATLTTLLIPPHTQSYWAEQYLWNDSIRTTKLLFLLLALWITWLTHQNPHELTPRLPEFHALTLLAFTGLLLLPSAQSFPTLFISLELITVTLYILVSYHRTHPPALEAGIKYLIIGSVASAFMIMGIAYLFGFTGTLQFKTITTHNVWSSTPAPLWIAPLFLLAGIAFKASLVPFHAWAPDVYQGTNHPTTALLATASKAAGVLLLFFLFTGPLRLLLSYPSFLHIFLTLGLLSILIGNFSALHQPNLKRLLAYSGIGHAGFMALPLTHFDTAGQTALLTYLLTYLLASITTFTVLTHVTPQNDTPITQYTALAKRNPLLALALTLALTSMAGIPPLPGFTGKWLIFTHLWQHGHHLTLAIALISTVVALAYYIAIIKTLFSSTPPHLTDPPPTPIHLPLSTTCLITLLSATLVILGLWPTPLLHITASLL